MPNRTRVNGNILVTQDETGGLHGRDVEFYIMVADRVLFRLRQAVNRPVTDNI